MGYTTDFVGHIDIDPRLNQAEADYLRAFSTSRRWDRSEGPYFVPGNPRAEERPDEMTRYNSPPPGQPQLWCQWVVCSNGDCLSWDGTEKFYEPLAWLRYLIQHFLSPTARCRTSGAPDFQSFTFDHVLGGTIVGCRRDTRELFAIRVRNNRVTKQVMRSGDTSSWDYQLAYEQENDRWQEAHSRRRRNRNLVQAEAESRSTVVDLEARRG